MSAAVAQRSQVLEEQELERELEELAGRDREDDEEDISVRRIIVRRTSPPITVNRNGSRYIAPIDIVRSKPGRAEIQRQQRPPANEEKPSRDDSSKGGEQT